MRPEETFCQRCFDGYLRAHCGLHPEWWPGPDPPDYFMAIEGSTFAVEVTRLIGRVGGPGGPSMGDAAYEASMQRLCAEIEQAALDQGILRGLHLLNPVGPFTDWARARRLIRASALDHIRTTRAANTTPWHVIFSESAEQTTGLTPGVQSAYDSAVSMWISGHCTIAKLADSPDAVQCVATAPGRVLWEGQALARACRMLQRAIIKKKRQLTNICSPKILLLLHEWPMVHGSIYSQCVDRLRFLDCFHSLFLVQARDQGYFLHTYQPTFGIHPSTRSTTGP
jgi:hypothetical protein